LVRYFGHNYTKVTNTPRHTQKPDGEVSHLSNSRFDPYPVDRITSKQKCKKVKPKKTKKTTTNPEVQYGLES
jgi:hypothetical protein